MADQVLESLKRMVRRQIRSAGYNFYRVSDQERLFGGEQILFECRAVGG